MFTLVLISRSASSSCMKSSSSTISISASLFLDFLPRRPLLFCSSSSPFLISNLRNRNMRFLAASASPVATPPYNLRTNTTLGNFPAARASSASSSTTWHSLMSYPRHTSPLFIRYPRWDSSSRCESFVPRSDSRAAMIDASLARCLRFTPRLDKFRSRYTGSLPRTMYRVRRVRAAVTTGRKGSRQYASPSMLPVCPVRGSMTLMTLEMFFTNTRREMLPMCRASFLGRKSKSSLQRVHISTRLVYL
mmetsp:Transcript_36272/g.87533  ORF Transcript_36272/g.87533 Transcript_36272/m.87533 type:complete len:248 (-) Transcript_36272:869-1612(-)